MNINLNSEQMEAMVAKAIFDTLTGEQRDALIQASIREVLTKPEKNSVYGSDRRSPLQRAFDEAVYIAAQRIARDRLAEDKAIAAQLDSIFAEATAKVFAGEGREKLVDSIAEAMREGLRRARDY